MTGAVGLAINRLRHERGWSAQRLAEECARLGLPSLTRGTIAKIESGARKSVTADELITLARALEVTAEDLVAHEPAAAAPSLVAAGTAAAAAAHTVPAKRSYRGSRPLMSRQTVRELRSDLSKLYQAALDRRIVMGSLPQSVVVPTIAAAFVMPQFRIATIEPSSSPSDEAWWLQHRIRDDLQAALVSYLASPAAMKSPLLILGQPGSGKSLLTQVLAARLSGADFTPLRIALRTVPAEGDLQEQIEYSIRMDTGRTIDWPTFARSIGNSLPVVLLDGLDELVTAPGVSHSDYLLGVAQFQRRESELGRPIAAVVTSRTVYADKMRTPPETVAMRLEPFDDARIAQWLQVWNASNTAELAARGLRPLSLQAVLAQEELARHPLLLLMLALADADDNAVQNLRTEGPRNLYERLLVTFTRREVANADTYPPGESSERVVEDKLDELSIAAFAMFNRGSQQVRVDDLEVDLRLLRKHQSVVTPSDGFRAPQRLAEELITRFFFVHSTHAMREAETTYEFLHATFADYLMARLTWQVLRGIDDVLTGRTRSAPDDRLLCALLSFRVLSNRQPIVTFLSAFASSVAEADRDRLLQLLVRLLEGAHHTRLSTDDSYQPRWLTPMARHATYTANLVLLAVAVAGSVHVTQLFTTSEGAVDCWHRQALLWRSQLQDDEWLSLVGLLQIDRVRTKGLRDIVVGFSAGSPVPNVGLSWLLQDTPHRPRRWPTHYLETWRRAAFFQNDSDDDLLHHAIEPLTQVEGGMPEAFAPTVDDNDVSALNTLILAWLAPTADLTEGQRRDIYQRCARIAALDTPSWNAVTRNRYLTLLLDRLATDESAPVDITADLLDGLVVSRISEAVCAAAMRCASALLGRDPAVDQRIGVVLARLTAARGGGSEMCDAMEPQR
jgi:transcriptional regulator with XRE-family HTH domain